MTLVTHPEYDDGHIYMIPRLFNGDDHDGLSRHACMYDLCSYHTNLQRPEKVGVMAEFYVLESDNRRFFPNREIWSTSGKKVSFHTRKAYYAIDMTHKYAYKIQKWFTDKKKQRAAHYISHMLFNEMIQPEKGWLFKKAQQRWNRTIIEVES